MSVHKMNEAMTDSTISRKTIFSDKMHPCISVLGLKYILEVLLCKQTIKHETNITSVGVGYVNGNKCNPKMILFTYKL